MIMPQTEKSVKKALEKDMYLKLFYAVIL